MSKRLGGCVVVGLGLAVLASGCGAAAGDDRVALPDGRRLHVSCAGQGSPTVVFESGFGATAAAWDKVAPVLAQQTRVCVYDRAGYGASDPGPLPRDGGSIAKDLDQALRAAKISGPLIMVGHSAGGLYVRIFADRRPRDVVGMVLVDPSVDHQDRQLSLNGERAADLSGIRRGVQHCLDVAQGWTQDDAARCRGEGGRMAPPAAWADQLSELDTLWETTSDEVSTGRATYGDMPLIVLTAGGVYDGAPEPLRSRVLALWREAHRDIALKSSQGEERLIDSPHLIMVKRPDAVIDAVREVLMKAKARQGR